MHQSIYSTYGKRALDVLASSLGLLILAPVGLLVACLVRFRLGSPILFKQQRAGRDGKPFLLFKFRSMTDATGPDGTLLPDGQRLTPFGKFLRGTSLDELPQLLNVVRGDMSLVGPRPLLMRYLERYSPHQARRHEIRPGLTGWAQVNGRNAVSWETKFDLDVWYVDHVSLWVDLKILVRTAMRLVRPVGVTADGHATMPEFMGSPPDSNRKNGGMSLQQQTP